MINEEILLKRKKELEEQHKITWETLNAIHGALQENQYLLNLIKSAPKGQLPSSDRDESLIPAGETN